MSEAGASEATPATRLQLEVVAGNATGTTIGVEERLVFGRQSEGPGQLADDPELSRHHAEIARRPTGEYQLEDLSSTNGTYVNGTRLQAPVVLVLGDTLELGTTKLVVRALPVVAAPAPGAVDVRAATVVVDVPTDVRQPKAQPEAPSAPAPPPAAPATPAAAPPPAPATPPATPPAASTPPPAPATPPAAPATPPAAPASPPAPTPPPATPAPPSAATPPPPPPPPLELRLRVDLERAEAEIALGEGQAVRLRLQEGRWLIVDGDAQ